MSAAEANTQNSRERTWDHHGSYQWTYFGEHVKQRISYFLSQRLSGRNLELGGGWYLSHPNSVVVDLSPVCLGYNLAKEKHQFDLDTLETGKRLPFMDNSFDSATMISAWQYLAAPHAVASELERVVRPGGELYIINGQGAGLEGCVVNHTNSRQIQDFFKERGLDTLTEVIPVPGSTRRDRDEFQSVCVAMPEDNIFSETVSQVRNKNRRAEQNQEMMSDPSNFETGFIAAEVKKIGELLGQFRRYPVTQYSRDCLTQAEDLGQRLYQLTGELPIIFSNLSNEIDLNLMTPGHRQFFASLTFIGEDAAIDQYKPTNPAVNEILKACGVPISRHIGYFPRPSVPSYLQYCQEYGIPLSQYNPSGQDYQIHESALWGIVDFLSSLGLNSFAKKLQGQVYETMKPLVPDLDQRLAQKRVASYYHLVAEHKQRRRIDRLIKQKDRITEEGIQVVGEGKLETFHILSELPRHISTP